MVVVGVVGEAVQAARCHVGSGAAVGTEVVETRQSDRRIDRGEPVIGDRRAITSIKRGAYIVKGHCAIRIDRQAVTVTGATGEFTTCDGNGFGAARIEVDNICTELVRVAHYILERDGSI